VHLRSLLLLSLAFWLGLTLAVPALAAPIRLAGYTFDPQVGEPVLPEQLRAADARDGAADYYLVQAAGPIEAAWRGELTAAGAEVYGYLPDFAYLVRLTPAARALVAQLSLTAWVGPYHPAYKISPQIGTQQFVTPERSEDPLLHLMVRVFGEIAPVAARVRALGGEVLDATNDGHSRRLLVRLAEASIPALAREREVWWIEEQPEFTTQNNTTKWVVQSNQSGWTPLWDEGIYGENEIVTIMDSGVDYNSCWFREDGSAPPGPSHRKVIDYTTFGGGVAYDGCDNGHGSHVAGTICGDQSYVNPGNYNYNGMAYKAKMTVQDVGADDWSACSVGAIAVPSSLTSAFNASRALGARVHTNSWGSTSNAYDGYCVDIDSWMWNHPDFLILFAAGNSGPSGSTVGSPGTAKNCVTVGATRQAPNQESMASYSSRGPASDNRYKPTVTAPGGESPTYITSVDNDPGSPPSATCNAQGSPFQGTSMATPATAGMALNVRQYFRDGFYPQGEAGGDPLSPSAALVKAVLISSSDDMGSANIPNNDEGWGRIMLDNSLYFDGDLRELMVETPAAGLETGASWELDVDVDDYEPLYITLVWTDYPGSSGGGVALVNDLDLIVTSPSGAEYKGNVFSSGYSIVGGAHDHRNVEECVRIQTPQLGSYTVRVSGYNVPQGPQPFALALNGSFANWPPGGFSAVTPEAELRSAQVAISPNPALQATQLAYTVPHGYAGPVELVVVDVTGRTVRQLVAKGQRGGEYRVTWDGLDGQRRPVSEGIYFVRLSAGSETATCKVVIQR